VPDRLAAAARRRAFGDLGEFGLPMPIEGPFTGSIDQLGLEPLVGHLGVLTPEGEPIAVGATPAAVGLYFDGLLARPSLIGYIGKQSRRPARRIAG
jgi:hypothetical protein